jgi:hypothetical protein
MKRIGLVFGLLLLALTSTSATWGQSGGEAPAVPLEEPSLATLTCSPAPCVFTPTQVTQGGGYFASVAANPVSPQDLLVATNTNCGPGTLASKDGGLTWASAICDKSMYIYSPYYDPLVAYDRNGTAYTVANYVNNDNFSLGIIGFEKSSDGLTWGPPTRVGSLSPFIAPDSPALAVDTNSSSPHLNSLYVSSTQFECLPACYGGTRVVVASSGDGGTTWQTSAVTPWEPTSANDEYSALTVGKDGTVYLTWQYCPSTGFGQNECSNSIAYIAFSKSTDGGKTWSKQKRIAQVTLTTGGCTCGYEGVLPGTKIGVPDTPAIGVDNTTGPHSGYLYVVMYNWTGTYMQVQVVHSPDGGTTWSRPVPVAPSATTHDQFFPWLSVSPSGDVGVSWLDRRNDPANLSYQAFAAVSTDGGKSFGTNWQLTTAFSNPLNDGSGGTFLGNYTGNTWVGGTLYAVWMDTSNGVSSQDVIGGLRLK